MVDLAFSTLSQPAVLIFEVLSVLWLLMALAIALHYTCCLHKLQYFQSRQQFFIVQGSHVLYIGMSDCFEECCNCERSAPSSGIWEKLSLNLSPLPCAWP